MMLHVRPTDDVHDADALAQDSLGVMAQGRGRSGLHPRSSTPAAARATLCPASETPTLLPPPSRPPAGATGQRRESGVTMVDPLFSTPVSAAPPARDRGDQTVKVQIVLSSSIPPHLPRVRSASRSSGSLQRKVAARRRRRALHSSHHSRLRAASASTPAAAKKPGYTGLLRLAAALLVLLATMGVGVAVAAF